MFVYVGNFIQKNVVTGLLLFVFINFVHTKCNFENCEFYLPENRHGLYTQYPILRNRGFCNSTNYSGPIPSFVNITGTIEIPIICQGSLVCDDGYGLQYGGPSNTTNGVFKYIRKDCLGYLDPGNCRHKYNFPQCKRKCPKLRTTGLNLVLKCSLDGVKRSCKYIHLDGTIVEIRCMKYYHQERPVTYDQIRCMENGEWSNPLYKCILDCGKAVSTGNSSKIKLSPSELELAGSPWYALIYNQLKEKVIQSGIIISDRAVLTKGDNIIHLVDCTETLLYQIDSIEVVVGENVIGLIQEEISNEYGKTYSVKDIREQGYYRTILILHDSIQLNKYILPICINYGKETISSRLSKGDEAKIFVFWSSTTNKTNIVTSAKVTIEKVLNDVEPKPVTEYKYPHLTYTDRPSSYWKKTEVAWGQGIVFRHQDDNLHYLHGILLKIWGKYESPDAYSSDASFITISKDWIKQILEEIEYENIGIVLECGKIFIPLTPQVRGGVKDIFGTSPWHVALYRTRNQETILICGGTIIAKRVILSAAHCFFGSNIPTTIDMNSYEIVVAKTTRNYNITDNAFQKSYKIKDIIYPDTYHGIKTYYTSDIALIVLQENIEFSTVVRPACTEFSSEDAFSLKTGNIGKVAGWGKTESGKESDTLLTANVSFLDHTACTSSVKQDVWDSITIDKFCARNENGSVVDHGDSGGGFVFLHPDYKQYYVRGIVSTKLAQKSPVAIYTDVSFHKNWIQRTLRSII